MSDPYPEDSCIAYSANTYTAGDSYVPGGSVDVGRVIDWHDIQPLNQRINIQNDTILQFEDGTEITGELLVKSLQALHRILEQDYPEALL